ncbi:alpha/beta hydrolase family protein [Haladaptatus sp. NG-WS-4]
MMYDQLSYWPEEEYVGRSLAPSGFRVVLPESPWHGRRESPGHYSGEPYLRSMPVTLFQLYAAQAQEIAVLTGWAREQGAPTVGVGGVSLGGIVTLFVAGHSDEWPDRYRPDAAFPVAMSAKMDELVLGSSMVALLDGIDALRDAGWDTNRLRELAPLLRPPETPGVDPENVYPFGGLRDGMTDYESASELFDRWGVPASNRTVWDCGHFGTLLRVIRKDDYQKRVAAVLSEGGV